jgi:ferredoxin
VGTSSVARRNEKKDVFEREDEIMKYRVNEECIGCGLCAGTCPEVFSMGDDGVAVAIETEVPEEALNSAAEAKDGCPVGAIEEA